MTSTRLTSAQDSEAVPHEMRDRRPWRVFVGRNPGLNHCLRGSVFAAGLVLVLGGAALWLFSMVLTAPLLFAGLWVWSWEFVWAKRLLHRFRIWLGRFWDRVRARPKRWTVLTALGILSGAAMYWAYWTWPVL